MTSRMSTRRQQLIARLELGPVTARALAKEFGVPISRIVDDLQHVQKSLGRRLRVEPACCEGCDYLFTKRKRLTAPSRCPRCKSERTTQPLLCVEGGSR